MIKILVIIPHGDDEVLGCGGTLIKLKDSCYISTCYITEPIEPKWNKSYCKNRESEIMKVSELMEVFNRYELHYPSGKLDTVNYTDIYDTFNRIILELKPDVLFIPNIDDLHYDHQIISDVCLTSLRHKFIKYILSYEIISDTIYTNFNPNVYVDISNEFEKKLELCNVYSSEMKEWPHPRSIEGITRLSKMRGLESGYEYAEAFKLIRGKYD